jgi:ABC-2 type transport system ATP-binding protein
VIEVRNLTKHYGRQIGIQDLSFEAKRGEVLGFLGPNGAGKTTTLRILTGFLSADRGTAFIDGIDIGKDPVSAQKRIGYLPENNPLYKNMNPGEFLDLAARLHRIPAQEKRDATDFAVRSVGIEKVFYRPIGELSKGFKQRVGIAAALIHRPKVIILDEPTEGLDPNQRSEIRQLIRDLSREHTIIMSTHVMQEASAVCSRMLIINGGKLVADGTADELSTKSRKEKVLLLEIEGERVEESVRKIAGAGRLKVQKLSGNCFGLEVATEMESELRPALSRLAWENKWVIWKLDEQRHNLEDIFQTLTKE